MTVEIVAAESTKLFIGTDDAPRQVVHVVLRGHGCRAPPTSARVTVEGPGLEAGEPIRSARSVRAKSPGSTLAWSPAQERRAGETIDAEVVVADGSGDVRHPFELVVAEPGWRMFMVSHFHYDPVWWNTQAAYTETWGTSDPVPARRSRSRASRSSRRTSRWPAATRTTSSCSPSSTT